MFYMHNGIVGTMEYTWERVQRIANRLAVLPVKFQTGSTRTYTHEYMELNGVILWISNINSYEQHNLICDIDKITLYWYPRVWIVYKIDIYHII